MSHSEIPLVDVGRQHERLEGRLAAAFTRVLRSSRFILGEEVKTFEQEVAAYLGVPETVGVSSGTDALVLALLASGVRSGDEVVTTPFSFFATVGSILRIGAIPRFADIGRDDFNIDPAAVERAITPRTRAVICVHLFGDPADALKLRSLCDASGVKLIEDAAQAMSAESSGRKVGAWGDFGCFSFFPSKPLGGLGDGGLISAATPELAERCRLLRAHGSSEPHVHRLLGGNHRLDALHAALLREKLPSLEGWRRRRAEHAAAYDTALEDCTGLLATPGITQGTSPPISAHAHYTRRLAPAHLVRRDEILAAMKRAGVQTAVYYRRPLYAQPVPELAATLRGDESALCPNAEARCNEVFTLPMFPELAEGERDRVATALREQLG